MFSSCLYFLLVFIESVLSLYDDAGVIAYFANACPEGWETYTSGNGRFILSSGDYNSITYAINSTGGEDKVLLKQENLASHTHVNGEFSNLLKYTGCDTTKNVDCSNGEPDVLSYATLSNVGNDVPHNNMPQYLTLALCIKIQNSFTLMATQNVENTILNQNTNDVETASFNNITNLNQMLQTQILNMKNYFNIKINQINTNINILSSTLNTISQIIDKNKAIIENEIQNNITSQRLEDDEKYITFFALSSQINNFTLNFQNNLSNLSILIEKQMTNLINAFEQNVSNLNLSFYDEMADLHNSLKYYNQSSGSLPIGVTTLVLSTLNLAVIISYTFLSRKRLHHFSTPSTPFTD